MRKNAIVGFFVCLDTRTDIVELDPYQYGRSLQFSLSIGFTANYGFISPNPETRLNFFSFLVRNVLTSYSILHMHLTLLFFVCVL